MWDESIDCDHLYCSTIITIAHRLNTVLGYHKVMVLDHGSLVQCDTPANLLAREGLFREMASAAGLVKN